MNHCKQVCLRCTWVTRPVFLTWPGTRTVQFSTTRLLSRNRMINYFKPKRAAVLSKMTRYEFEKRLCDTKTEEELKRHLDSKNSDYKVLLERHMNHFKALEIIQKNLVAANIDTRVVTRFDFNSDVIKWADVIFTAGGDGTFLLAASKVLDKSKPVIGINTDPDRSEGCLLLPKDEYAAVNFEAALRRLLVGDFSWKWRNRIRITMSGYHANDEAIELHDQQLQFMEHRFTEHVQENEMHEVRRSSHLHHKLPKPKILPVLALNEVFIGESLSSRVSYYELSVNDMPREKQKSSGITICTGTGSSSWYFNINQIHVEAVKDILSIANKHKDGISPVEDAKTLERIAQEFNSSLCFDASKLMMAYTIRDPVVNGVFHVSKPRGFAKRLSVLSRMWDACLVVDGGSSFKFNDGARATFEIHDDDALRTVSFD
ncbi:NAD kinase 2, mitochondrial-like [Gigantopelta aegis]|uniref:NAD kinase 2, mitochondrial-like n=1 Tax=Gigantopelta aegis TaxID=1735272 RepID=UPI001B887D01|nr:NAD kinase 2, mitochondrial-like [Gigantopelta aegis]